MGDTYKGGDGNDFIGDCKMIALYKQPLKISYWGRLNNSKYNAHVNCLTESFLDINSYIFGYLLDVEMVINVVNIDKTFEILQVREMTEEQIENGLKRAKDIFANIVLKINPFIQVAISFIDIYLAYRRQRPVIAAQLLEEAFSTAEHLEPCYITARLWGLRGFFLWCNLDTPVFCEDPFDQFEKIGRCYEQCHYQLMQDINKGGFSNRKEAATVLSCMVRVKLMLPAKLENKHGKILNYIKHYKPLSEQLWSASNALMSLQKEVLELDSVPHLLMFIFSEIFMRIRLIDFWRNIGNEGGALKTLNQLLGIKDDLSQSIPHSTLCETVQTLIEERERDLRKSRIVALHGPPALPKEKVDTESGSSLQEMSNNSSSVNSAE